MGFSLIVKELRNSGLFLTVFFVLSLPWAAGDDSETRQVIRSQNAPLSQLELKISKDGRSLEGQSKDASATLIVDGEPVSMDAEGKFKIEVGKKADLEFKLVDGATGETKSEKISVGPVPEISPSPSPEPSPSPSSVPSAHPSTGPKSEPSGLAFVASAGLLQNSYSDSLDQFSGFQPQAAVLASLKKIHAELRFAPGSVGVLEGAAGYSFSVLNRPVLVGIQYRSLSTSGTFGHEPLFYPWFWVELPQWAPAQGWPVEFRVGATPLLNGFSLSVAGSHLYLQATCHPPEKKLGYQLRVSTLSLEKSSSFHFSSLLLGLSVTYRIIGLENL
ncbi:MAG: hypothetical protein JNL01_15285 [Bdellovibrionales bacterium]|nr:hypothetical protein [Bdellovibrionales bacterium]